jgi:hypothetical protein
MSGNKSDLDSIEAHKIEIADLDSITSGSDDADYKSDDDSVATADANYGTLEEVVNFDDDDFDESSVPKKSFSLPSVLMPVGIGGTVLFLAALAFQSGMIPIGGMGQEQDPAIAVVSDDTKANLQNDFMASGAMNSNQEQNQKHAEFASQTDRQVLPKPQIPHEPKAIEISHETIVPVDKIAVSNIKLDLLGEQVEVAAKVAIDESVLPKVAVDASSETVIKDVALAQAVSANKPDMDVLAPYFAQLNSNINSAILEISAANDENGKIIADLTSRISSNLTDTKVNLTDLASIPRLSLADKDKLINGRQRLKGFSVVNISLDRKMSIIKTPSNSINVYYPGEVFKVKEFGLITVSSIEDNGFLVIAGEKWFIDDKLEVRTEKESAPKPLVDKKKPALKTEQKFVIKPVEASANDVAKVDAKERLLYQALDTNAVNGWVLNAVYPSGFLLQDPTGEWRTFSIGDKIDGIGVVTGLDKDGSLKVGAHLIKMIKE